jgi:hypothetical protein
MHGIRLYFSDLAVTPDEVHGPGPRYSEKPAVRLLASNGIRRYRELPGEGIRLTQDGN